MTKATKEKWLAALRSGEYAQGEGYLNADGRYCCLGVLCEVRGLKARPADPNSPESDGSNQAFQYAGRLAMPRSETLRSLGLPPYNAEILADMNDDGRSFEDIAQWIEENL